MKPGWFFNYDPDRDGALSHLRWRVTGPQYLRGSIHGICLTRGGHTLPDLFGVYALAGMHSDDSDLAPPISQPLSNRPRTKPISEFDFATRHRSPIGRSHPELRWLAEIRFRNVIDR